MGSVDLVVQIEAPPSVAAGLQRVGPGRAPGRRRLARGRLPQAPGRPALLRGRGRADARRPDRGDALPAQPARRAGPADRGHGGDGPVAGRRPGRAGAPGRALRRAADVGARGDAGHALRALPVDRLRRAAPAAGLGPGRATCSPAAPGAQRLAVTSGGTIPDRGLFGVFLARHGGRRHGPAGRPGRRARRGDGLRVAGRRRLPARLDLLAHRGHHARPGAGLARARRGRPDAVLEGRPARAAGRAGPGDRRPSCATWSGTGAERAGGRPGRRWAWTPGRWTTCSPMWTSSGEATRHLPDDRTVVVERFRDELGDWRLAVHCVLGAKVNGAWALAIGRRLTERYGVRRAGAAERRRHRGAAARRGRQRRPRRATRGRPGRLRPGGDRPARRGVRSAARRCSPPGSASARPGRCCCPAATRAAASRCGSSASGRPSCSTWPASSPTSR